MNKILTPLLLLPATLLLASCSLPTRMVRFSPMLIDSLKAARVNIADYERKFGKYDGVFLLSEQVIEHVANDPLTYWQCYKMKTLRYLVLNPDAEWLTTFNLGTDPGNNLMSAAIHIINPDGTTHSYTQADLKQSTASDGAIVYKLAYPDIKKGSIVQESYEMRLEPRSSEALSPNINLQYAVPAERVLFEYALPSSWGLAFKKIAPDKPMKMEVAGNYESKTIYKYEANDVPPIQDEPYAPYFKEVANYIECTVDRVGDFAPADRKQWTSLTRVLEELINDDSYQLRAVRDAVDTVIGGKSGELEKLNAITKFVQKNIKVGPSSYKNEIWQTLEEGEGNLFQICWLTRGMLEDAGLRARVLFAHSARGGYFDLDYISADQLDIPVVEATVDGKSFIIFPYWKNYPVNVIPDHLQEQQAVILGGESGFGGFLKLPIGDTTANTLDDSYALTIDEEGDIAVEEERTLHGSSAFWERERLAAMNEEDTKKEMRDILTYSDGDVKIKDYEIIDKSDYDKPLVVKIRYTIDNLVTVTPEEVIFQTGGLFSPSTSRKRKMDMSERQNPIRIYENEELNKKIVIRYPASWKLTTPLENTSQSNEFGTISGSYSIADGALTVQHHRVLNRASAPKEKAPELLAVTGIKSRLNVPSLVFKVGP